MPGEGKSKVISHEKKGSDLLLLTLSTYTVILKWGRFCLTGNTQQCLETFLVVTTGGMYVVLAPSG